MMSMHFPYGNTNTVGRHLYGTSLCPNFGVNYNHYFPSFYSNSNGLLPTPLMDRNISLNNRECKPLMSKGLLDNPFLMPYEQRYDINSNDFLTFIEQKPISISELNPFANEFSLMNNTKNSNNQLVSINQEKISSSYKLIFDDLIEQSLQSIDAIKKASKTISVHHVSTQCDHQSIDQINRSTQTTNDNDQYNLLEEYSSRSVKLMKTLLENLKYFTLLSMENNSINHMCDELYSLILVTNQLILSINQNNMIKDRSIQSSPIVFDIEERTRRLISSSSSISHSSTPSFSSRQIHPITMKRSKLCLLCRKPVDDSDDVMHKLCRLLSSPLDV